MARFLSRSERTQPAPPMGVCRAKSLEDDRPGLPVHEHCRIVGAVAAGLRRRMPVFFRRELSDGICTLVASHDVGKCSPGYQLKYFRSVLADLGLAEQYPDAGAYETKHAVISEAALRAWAKGKRPADWEAWAKSAGAHHGSRCEPLAKVCADKYGGEAWARLRGELLEKLIEEFGDLPAKPPTPEQVLLASGFTSVADWLGSDEIWFPPAGLPEGDDLDVRVEHALDRAGWRWPKAQPGLSFADLFGQGFEPNSLQRAVHDAADRPGLFVVEAPTGMGKTEAALWAGYRLMGAGYHHGLYFALPTRLTSDRIHRRVAAFLRAVFGGEAGARLAHGTAWMSQSRVGGEELAPGGAWFHPLKRALLEPFGVGTVDQALMAVLCVRHAFVRAFGLAGKVVILDEVHSYDMYTGTLLDRLVYLLRRLGCSVIITSATLTARRRQAFFSTEARIEATAYPLVTAHRDQAVGVHEATAPPGRTIACRFVGEELEEAAERAVRCAEAGACVLWVNNTVARSQSALRAVRGVAREGLLTGLIHSRFPAWRREELEEAWMDRLGRTGDRPAGCVLVATQVAEQSVDIDADLLISDLAPTDMLLQRMGRLWRHERAERPMSGLETWIITPDLGTANTKDELLERLGPSRFVYAPYVLWKTHAVWSERDHVRLPDELRSLLEATYAEPTSTEPGWAVELHQEMGQERQKLRQKAMALSEHGLPALDDHEEVATRHSDRPMVDALLVRSCQPAGDRASLTLADGEELDVNAWQRNWTAAREVHRNLVRLPKYPDFKDTKRAAWLKKTIHDETSPVLRITQTGDLVTLDGAATRYTYDDQLGVRRLDQAPDADRDDGIGEDPFDGSDW